MKHITSLLCAAACMAALGVPAGAAAVESGEMYCFDTEVFAPAEAQLTGICITRLPERALGTVMLGDRCLRPGDVLTAEQIAEMTFVSNESEESSTASISYLPVFANGLSGEATMTLSIRGRENKAPIAEDSALETYKNLEVTGKLRVHDPEGQEMQFSVVRPPKRGELTINGDGSFLYTPKKNKVGIDSFVFTATDPAGKVSRETTVTVTILKPSDAKQYTDTAGKSCRFAAEWMRNTGIFVGESVGGCPCFSPEKPVTRGEFLTMMVKALNVPTDTAITDTGYEDAPNWLKPYLAAAIRSGFTAGLPTRDSFGADEWITSEEAASLLCTALKLQPQGQPVLSAEETAVSAVAVLNENGFALAEDTILTRGEAAQVLYRAVQIDKL